MKKIGGLIFLKVDGELLKAKGSFSYNLGIPKREAVLDAGGAIAGYKETPQVPFIEGSISDYKEFDLARLLKMEEVTRFRMTTHPVEFDMYYSL